MYEATGGTYSAHVFRPVMGAIFDSNDRESENPRYVSLCCTDTQLKNNNNSKTIQ